MTDMKKEKDQYMIEFGQRLKAVMAAKGIRKGVDLANISGFTTSFVSQMINGQAIPSTPNLALMAKRLGVSLEYLATGLGPMMTNKAFTSNAGITSVPVINEADIKGFLCGESVTNVGSEHLPGAYAFNSFIVEMPDNSMAPDIYKGERILIEPMPKVEPGQFSAYISNDELVVGVKRASETLIPSNEVYAPIHLKPDDMLVGRVRLRLSKHF